MGRIEPENCIRGNEWWLSVGELRLSPPPIWFDIGDRVDVRQTGPCRP